MLTCQRLEAQASYIVSTTQTICSRRSDSDPSPDPKLILPLQTSLFPAVLPLAYSKPAILGLLPLSEVLMQEPTDESWVAYLVASVLSHCR